MHRVVQCEKTFISWIDHLENSWVTDQDKEKKKRKNTQSNRGRWRCDLRRIEKLWSKATWNIFHIRNDKIVWRHAINPWPYLKRVNYHIFNKQWWRYIISYLFHVSFIANCLFLKQLVRQCLYHRLHMARCQCPLHFNWYLSTVVIVYIKLKGIFLLAYILTIYIHCLDESQVILKGVFK